MDERKGFKPGLALGAAIGAVIALFGTAYVMDSRQASRLEGIGTTVVAQVAELKAKMRSDCQGLGSLGAAYSACRDGVRRQEADEAQAWWKKVVNYRQ